MQLYHVAPRGGILARTETKHLVWLEYTDTRPITIGATVEAICNERITIEDRQWRFSSMPLCVTCRNRHMETITTKGSSHYGNHP